MSACEHCWGMRFLLGKEYHDVIAQAERENWPCTQPTPEGDKLRAGQFWDDVANKDRRDDIRNRHE